jgi:hypothetical protein
MNGNSKNDKQKRGHDEAIEGDPQSKHGDEGKSVNGGRQAGPNSARSGEPITPQTGEPIEHSH